MNHMCKSLLFVVYKKKLIAWLQNLYTHSTLKFYTQAIIIEYKKLFTTIFKTLREIYPCDIAKIRFCVLEHIIEVNFIFTTPGKHDFCLPHSKLTKTNHLWLTGSVKQPFCSSEGGLLVTIFFISIPFHLLSPQWNSRCGRSWRPKLQAARTRAATHLLQQW